MSRPVILLDAGELVALPGANNGDVLTWNATTGAWQASPGGGAGTVTSVALSTGSTGLTVSGGTTQTITGAGTFTIGGTLGTGNGGTGLGAPASGNAGKVLAATALGTYELVTNGNGTVTSVTAGAGLDGGIITTSGTISMPSVGTQGEYGSASSVAVVTTDQQGRVSGATTTTIAITQSQVADLVTDLASKADKSVTATASTGLTGGGTLASNFSFALDTFGTAQTDQGTATRTVKISTDAYGRVSSLTEQDIAGLDASVITSGQLSLAQGGTGIDASAVTGGQLLVGGTGVLALQSVSGDASLASTGDLTVTRLQGNPVSPTALGAPDAGKALVWSGSEWQASIIQGGGGGGGLTFFMNYAASSPYPLSTVYDENAGWNTGLITVDDTTAGTALGTFVTAVGQPSIEVIPAGLWDVNFYASSDAPANGVAVRVKVAILAGATQTVIATSDYVYLSDPSVTNAYTASVYVPATDVELTDRIEIIFEGRRFGATPYDVTLFFGDGTVSHVHTTINAPGGTGLVKVVDGFLQSPATLLVNADVASDAAVAVSKLSSGTDTYVLTTVAGVPTWQAPAATGVTSLTGTADQVLVDAGSGSPQTGALTLTLPQSISTGSSPTFAGLTLDAFSGLLRATGGVLAGGASVSLTSEVSGELPVLNGGTNLTSSGASGNLLVSNGSAWASVPMTGDATIASTGALTLKNTGTAGTYGSASAVPVFITDAQGRVTNVTNTNISIGASAISTGVFSLGRGGTGLSSYATGDLLLGAIGSSFVRLPAVATGNALISSGIATNPVYGKIGLTTHVSGSLPLLNGGTNASLTASIGQVAYSTASAIALTTGGTAGQFLAFNSGAAPTWSSISVADISDLASNYVRKFGTPQTVSSETGFSEPVGLSDGLTLDTLGDYKLTLYRKPGVGGTDSFVIVPQDTTDTGPFGLYAHDFFIRGQPNSNPTANGGGNLILEGGAGPSRALSGNILIGNGITQRVRIGNTDGDVYLDGPATFYRPAQFASTFTFNMLSGYVKANGAFSNVTASSTIPVSDVLGAAPINSPTFTGTVTIPSGASIADYLTESDAALYYLTKSEAVGIYAPINSPTFTGIVTIPENAVIEGYATQNFVNVYYLLKETATLTYAPIASPTFTGTVKLPLTTAGYVKTTSGGVISSSASVPTSDLSGAVAVTNGGTNNDALSVAQGTVYYGDGSKLVGLAPGTSGQFLQTQGAGANPQWASAGSATTPYDLRGKFVGTPASSVVLDTFIADRAATISATNTNHKFSVKALPSAGTVVLTVQRTRTTLGVPSTVTVFTATSSSTDTILNGYYPMTISAVTNGDLLENDVLEVVVQASAVDAAFATPVFTISAVA